MRNEGVYEGAETFKYFLFSDQRNNSSGSKKKLVTTARNSIIYVA